MTVSQELVQMKAAQGVICDVTPCLCQTPVKGKEGTKTSLSNPVKPVSIERSPSPNNAKFRTLHYTANKVVTSYSTDG